MKRINRSNNLTNCSSKKNINIKRCLFAFQFRLFFSLEIEEEEEAELLGTHGKGKFCVFNKNITKFFNKK